MRGDHQQGQPQAQETHAILSFILSITGFVMQGNEFHMDGIALLHYSMKFTHPYFMGLSPLMTFFSVRDRSLYGFRQVRGLLLSILIISVIETVLLIHLGWDAIAREAMRSSMLAMRYAQPDVGQKFMTGYKSELFAHGEGDVIQVGDSSGAYGVKPRVIEEKIPGLRYLNTNCCADTGWEGYAILAEHFLRYNPRARYLVVHATPYELPGHYRAGFTRDIYNSYGSFWRFFYRVPSLYYRKLFLTRFYRASSQPETDEASIVAGNLGIKREEIAKTGLDTLAFAKQTGGWFPYDISGYRSQMPVGKCGPRMMKYATDEKGRSLLAPALERLRKVALKYNVKLIVVFAPVACEESAAVEAIENEVFFYRMRHPDVTFIFPFIHTKPAADLSDQWHLNPPAAERYSRKLAEIFKTILKTGEIRQ